MKFNVKRIISSVLLSSVLFTTACSSVPEEELPVLKIFLADNTQAVVDMISVLPETATLENEKAIEDAYIEYCFLDETQKEAVTNFEKLADLRQQIAELYTPDKRGSRFSRAQILIGTYGFGAQSWNDEGVKALADCGIDYLASGSSDRSLLDLLDKYGVGNFTSGIVPGWWGGEGQNAGTMAASNPIESYEAAYANFTDHPAIWGICVGDEPHGLDAEHYGKVIDKVHELFPEQIVYLNLYPDVGESQLGFNDPREYYDLFAEVVNIDYLCFDYYCIYTFDKSKRRDNVYSLLKNMKMVYDSCHENDKEVWVVLQSSTQERICEIDPTYILSEEELRIQTSISLVYGAKAVSWACWNSGWFLNHAVDGSGNLTPLYYRLQKVNSELKALSPVYSKYTNVNVGYSGGQGMASFADRYISNFNSIDQDVFTNVDGDVDSALFVGYFEKNIGEGSALMIANLSDPMCEESTLPSFVTFTVANENAEVAAYLDGYAVELMNMGNGTYGYYLDNASNLFVTVE